MNKAAFGRLGAAAMLVFACGASAQPAIEILRGAQGPETLGFPAGMTPDGSVVVGHSGGLPCRWTPEKGPELIPLPAGALNGTAVDVSADGGVIVGIAYFIGNIPRAFRWTPETGTELLTLPSEAPGYPNAISTDGRRIVGVYQLGSAYRAFRWSEKEGAVDVGTLPGAAHMFATGASADGKTIVGTAYIGAARYPWRWSDQHGMQQLPRLAGCEFTTGAYISANGSVIAGSGAYPSQSQIGRWTEDSGVFTHLGVPPGAPTGQFNHAVACAMSDDGGSIGGVLAIMPLPGDEYDSAVYWTEETGMMFLYDRLVELGADPTGWRFERVMGFSADGSQLIGYGVYNDVIRGFRIDLYTCRADFNNDDVVGSQDFFDFLSAFFAQSQSADFNRDNAVNSQDLFDFLAAFFVPC